MLVLSFVNNLAVLSIALMTAGSGWIFIISSLHYSMFKSVQNGLVQEDFLYIC
jgi:hypothetical protein